VRDTGDSANKLYKFNYVSPPGEQTSAVFKRLVRPIVLSACHGYNGNVFAYGQTASGKTHTMLGTEVGCCFMRCEQTTHFAPLHLTVCLLSTYAHNSADRSFHGL
jgi:hypothetical protein